MLRAGISLQAAADFQAVDRRQQQVEQDQVRHVAARGGQRLFARRNAHDAIALLVEVVADQFEKVLLVVDHKHSLS